MKKNKGATTIVVICVMAVIMTLSMGLLLSASVLMKTSGRTLASEQCRILAVSFSKELEQELCDPEYRYENLEQEAADRISENGTISLWHYVRQNINDGSWPYYEESEGGIHGKDSAFREFNLKKTGATGEISDITLTIYWTRRDQQLSGIHGIPDQLIVKTTVEVKEQTCTITDIYQISESSRNDYEQWGIRHVERN